MKEPVNSPKRVHDDWNHDLGHIRENSVGKTSPLSCGGFSVSDHGFFLEFLLISTQGLSVIGF